VSIASWPCRFTDAREHRDVAQHIVNGTSLPIHHECFWRWGGVRFVTLLANQGNAAVRINARPEKAQP